MKIDLIIKNANIYNVFIKKWIHSNLCILNGKILYIGSIESLNIEAEKIIDINNQYIIPSFIDTHMHIESSFCTPEIFSKEAIKHGTTTVVAEPHEIANVFSKDGISQMIEQSNNQIVDIFYGLPSSVPSTSYNLENNGGEITKKDIEDLYENYNSIICLGEVMQYQSFINDFEDLATNKQKNKTIDLINATKEKNQLLAIEGHCPSVVDFDLASVLYFGVNSDHCLQTPRGMLNRFEQGMFVQLQDKSITKENIDLLINEDFSGLYSFVTDDCPPNILVEKGHIDYIFKKALSFGLSFEDAIIASSYSPAKRMSFRDRGAIAPGYIADFLIIDKLDSNFKILNVYKNGKNIETKNSTKNNIERRFPHSFYNSININKNFNIDNALNLKFSDKKCIKSKIMRKNTLSTYTELAYKNFEIKNNEIQWQFDNCNLVLSINRYGKNTYGFGFMDGTPIKNGALCSSHSHDSHNILLLGDNKKDMKIAYNRIKEIQGGIVLVIDNKIINEIPLSVGGIICEIEMETLSSLIIDIQNNLIKYGVNHPNPLMSLLTISLPVSPKIKISDKGLIDVEKQIIINLFE